jgi:hypothetical protein
VGIADRGLRIADCGIGNARFILSMAVGLRKGGKLGIGGCDFPPLSYGHGFLRADLILTRGVAARRPDC